MPAKKPPSQSQINQAVPKALREGVKIDYADKLDDAARAWLLEFNKNEYTPPAADPKRQKGTRGPRSPQGERISRAKNDAMASGRAFSADVEGRPLLDNLGEADRAPRVIVRRGTGAPVTAASTTNTFSGVSGNPVEDAMIEAIDAQSRSAAIESPSLAAAEKFNHGRDRPVLEENERRARTARNRRVRQTLRAGGRSRLKRDGAA